MDKKEQQREQQMRISDEEISTLKNTFAENDVLLKSVRKAMLRLPMEADEAQYLSDLFAGEELRQVIRRVFLPEIEGHVPLGQNLDLYMTLQMEGKSPEDVFLATKARQRLIHLIEEGLELLKSPQASNQIAQFTPIPDVEENYIQLVARNTLITHTDQQLLQVRILAGMKEETIEQTKERLKKDSNK